MFWDLKIYAKPQDSDLSKVRRLSDKDFNKWAERRKLGYRSFRRYFLGWLVLIWVIATFLLSVLLWLEVVPSMVLAFAVSSCIFVPPFAAFALGPMVWHTMEMQYFATLSDRETAAKDEDLYSDAQS